MILEAQNVHKSYGTLSVLKGIDLSIKAGEVVSVVGSSGAGKSTLLHILGTLDSSDSGKVLIDGKNISDLKGKELARFRNQKIGFVFQFHHLLPEFTALENVQIPSLIGGTNQREAKDRAFKLLDKLGLTARVNHKPSELSGGEQQRVAVARALANNPAVILADEPSGNLDSDTSRELHKLFFTLRKEFNQTFIIVTHNTELADMAEETGDEGWEDGSLRKIPKFNYQIPSNLNAHLQLWF